MMTMAKRIAVFLALALFSFMTVAAYAAPTLSVRAFDNKAGADAEAPAAAITDMMTTELSKAGIFNLLEREKLDYIAQEQKLSMSGLMDESTAPEIGRLKGARYSMTGAITVYNYNASAGAIYIPGIAGGAAAAKTAYVTLDIRVIDNETGEVVYAAAEEGRAKREAAGILSLFGGFGKASYGGILATAARDSVKKHVAALTESDWEN
jgi:curli biogenesis system outer membrane secretion channel CsgG